MDATEPLQDPKELKDQEMSESKKKSYNLVCENVTVDPLNKNSVLSNSLLN